MRPYPPGMTMAGLRSTRHRYMDEVHVVKFLLECGVSVDIRNGSGETSLNLASGRGELDVVRFLIEHGGDINVKSNKGFKGIHCIVHRQMGISTSSDC